jgi:hypothetical protein
MKTIELFKLIKERVKITNFKKKLITMRHKQKKMSIQGPRD